MRGRIAQWIVVTVLFSLGIGFASAQGETAAVPDLTGLNTAQAAAQLNKVGLAFGREIAVPIGEGMTPDVISGQSVAAGEPAAPGLSVDVEIPRSSNVRLIYDDNDLTVVNLGNTNIAIEALTFATVEGSREASFDAAGWGKHLRAGQCMQLWSVNRNGPKSLPDCSYIQNWMATTNANRHFWTASSGAQSFNVVHSDVERAVCQAAPPNSQDQPVSCELYLPAGSTGDVAEYIVLAYQADKLVVMNNSDNLWMPVNSVRIVNGLASPEPLGKEFRLNAVLFGRPKIVARINRLAPNQCLLFANTEADMTGLMDCDVIATLALAPAQFWWTANFEVLGSDGKRRTCNAATPDKLTLCIMPR